MSWTSDEIARQKKPRYRLYFRIIEDGDRHGWTVDGHIISIPQKGLHVICGRIEGFFFYIIRIYKA